MVKRLFLFCLIFALYSGCNKLNTHINAPSYIEIDDYLVITDSATQGTNNQKFTDVLVNTNTSSYGIYPIPGKIPIPISGAAYLSIRPVIKVNGVTWLKVDYPVFKGCDSVFPLTNGQTTKITPVWKYYTGANFRYLENFESSFHSLNNTNTVDTFCYRIDDTQKFDGKCMLIQLDSLHDHCTVQTSSAIPFPSPGTNTYLELNYASNCSFEVGIAGAAYLGDPFSFTRTISPGGGKSSGIVWKKMYFNLTDVARIPPVYSYYYIYFYAIYERDKFFPGSLNKIYIDNIKLVTQN